MLSIFQVLANYPNPHNVFVLLAHSVFWGKVHNDMGSNTVLEYMGILLKSDV